MSVPRHPEQHDDAPVEKATARSTKIIIVLVVALVVIVVALHLTGVIGR